MDRVRMGRSKHGKSEIITATVIMQLVNNPGETACIYSVAKRTAREMKDRIVTLLKEMDQFESMDSENKQIILKNGSKICIS